MRAKATCVAFVCLFCVQTTVFLCIASFQQELTYVLYYLFILVCVCVCVFSSSACFCLFLFVCREAKMENVRWKGSLPPLPCHSFLFRVVCSFILTSIAVGVWWLLFLLLFSGWKRGAGVGGLREPYAVAPASGRRAPFFGFGLPLG